MSRLLYTSSLNNYFAWVSDEREGNGECPIKLTPLLGASRILIAIPPDVGLLPYKAFIPAETSKKLSDLSKALQASLYGLLFQPPLPARPVYVDFFSLFNEIMTDPELYGFLPQSVNVSCLRGAYGEVPHRTLCSDPGRYIFWDEYHVSW